MKIKYLGHSCFKIISNQGNSLIADPYTGVGYELPIGLTADAVTTSHAHFDHNYIQAVQTNTVICTPGAHSVGDIQISGVSSWHDEQNGYLRGANIIYKFTVDEMVVCHLGDLGEKVSPELAERIGKVDILLLPVGGTYTIDAQQAKKLAEYIAPSIIIPMHFKGAGKLDISDVSVFLKQFPAAVVCEMNSDTYEINKQNLPAMMQIIYLERKKI